MPGIQQNSRSFPFCLILLAILSDSVMKMSNSAEKMMVGGIFLISSSEALEGNSSGSFLSVSRSLAIYFHIKFIPWSIHYSYLFKIFHMYLLYSHPLLQSHSFWIRETIVTDHGNDGEGSSDKMTLISGGQHHHGTKHNVSSPTLPTSKKNGR